MMFKNGRRPARYAADHSRRSSSRPALRGCLPLPPCPGARYAGSLLDGADAAAALQPGPTSARLGSYFVAQQGDPAGVRLLADLLDRAMPVAPVSGTNDRAGFDRLRETAALLHAAILTGTSVKGETLSQLVPVFPAQALILASRLPLAERTPLLLRWYELGDQTRGGDLTRTSAVMLAEAPPPRVCGTAGGRHPSVSQGRGNFGGRTNST